MRPLSPSLAFGLALAFVPALGCASAARPRPPAPLTARPAASSTDVAVGLASSETPDGIGGREEPAPAHAATWIGAAAESELVDEESGSTLLGVWVDVPDARPETRPPAQVALVIDTSGSMAGAKIENARAAATRVLDRLHDGDIVSLETFGDDASELVPPTAVSATSRVEIARRIARLDARGSTNLFAGLSLAESRINGAPASHPLRRIVLVSDGRATVGPSSARVLGALAERGRRNRAQIAALGVGLDYDEHTLDAIAVGSSGRLHHIARPNELEPVVREEMDLLERTLASDAFVEIVPARGVVVDGFEGEDAAVRDGESFRLPLGALFAGQHREALVRVRVVDRSAFARGGRPLASVRLRFADAQDGDVERVHEVVARGELSRDRASREARRNPRTHAIVALQEASHAKLEASRRVAEGDLARAEAELHAVEQRLVAEARSAATPTEKKRLEVAAAKIATARTATQAMPSAAPAARRDHALKLNAEGMHDLGY